MVFFNTTDNTFNDLSKKEIMRYPYEPLSTLIPINFNEKYHQYSVEGHSRIPSVTQIKKQIVIEDFSWWKKSLGVKYFNLVKNNISEYIDITDQTLCKNIIGEIIAKFDMNYTGDIGTQTHQRCEEFLKGIEFSHIDALAAAHFNNLEPYLHEISKIYAIEQPLTNKEYSYAGKPDLICKYRGKVTMLDFKTKRSIRKRDWIEGHFIQEAAYAKLWHENGGPKIEQLVLLISSRDNQKIGMEFIEEDIDPWIEKWDKILEEFLK